MSYFDGFLIPVPVANKEAYSKTAKAWSDICKAHGAIRLVEFWGDDIPDGKLTSLPMAVKLEPGETVVMSYLEWPDKATRDAANQKMMEDPKMANMDMPFDGRRMIFGGFEPIGE